MGGGGSGSSSQSGTQSSWSRSGIEIPPELKPLYTQSATGMQNLQNLAPLWGKQETVLREGAVPTATNYNYLPGTAASPEQRGQVLYYEDANGTRITPENAGLAMTPENAPEGWNAVFGPSTPGAPGTPGGYDYANPVFTYAPEDYITRQTAPNYLAENPMQVAPENELQKWAAANVTSLTNTPEGERIAAMYGQMAPLLAGRMATGAGVERDPAVLAANAAFDKLMAPSIENQMGLSGLGRSSSLANSLSLGKASQLAPLIQDYINREQNTLTNQANMYASLMPQFSALGGAETARLTAALNDAMQIGGTERGIAQEPLTAQYQDFLRRQALSEQALFVPFGAMASASIGPKSESQSQGQTSGTSEMSQGMFK